MGGVAEVVTAGIQLMGAHQERKAARTQRRNQNAMIAEEKQKELAAKLEKQEADYKRAMEAIDAIRAARAIEAMIRANDLGKNNGNETK